MNIDIRSKETDDSEYIWMNEDMHCLWPSVKCKQGLVVGLYLDFALVDGLSGHIMTLILSSGFKGLISTEMGSLSKLTSFRLSKHVFCDLMLCSETKHIHFMLLILFL